MKRQPTTQEPPQPRLLCGTPYCGSCRHRVAPDRCLFFGRRPEKILKSDKAAVAFEKIRMGLMTCMFWEKDER